MAGAGGTPRFRVGRELGCGFDGSAVNPWLMHTPRTPWPMDRIGVRREKPALFFQPSARSKEFEHDATPDYGSRGCSILVCTALLRPECHARRHCRTIRSSVE